MPHTHGGPERGADHGPRPGVAALLDALPLVELHLHLVGAASVDTVLELARRHPLLGVPQERDELARAYAFRDFAHFIEVYGAVSSLVREAADVTALVTGLGRDLAATGVRYAEVTVTPLTHLAQGIGGQDLADALDEGRRRARAQHGVELSWVFDVDGGLGPDAASAALDWVLRHRPAASVGFGLGGAEAGVARAQFARHFAVARDAGLRSLPHAGETTGPDEVWSALRDLGAERVGHGIGAAADPRLLEHLAEHGTTLEVCPTSNLRTGAVATIEDHPLPRLLEAGVPVALGSDDPGMFGTDLAREHRLVADALGLPPADLARLARTAVEASSCPEPLRSELLADVERALAGTTGQPPGA